MFARRDDLGLDSRDERLDPRDQRLAGERDVVRRAEDERRHRQPAELLVGRQGRDAQVHPHVDGAGETFDDAYDAGGAGLAARHEVGDQDLAGGRLPFGLQDRRVVPVAAAGVGAVLVGGGDPLLTRTPTTGDDWPRRADIVDLADLTATELKQNGGRRISVAYDDSLFSGPAVIVLPPHAVLLKHLKTPRAAGPKREQIVQFEVAQNIPYAIDEVVWDTVVSGEQEQEIDLLLAAAKLEVVEPLCRAAGDAGWEVFAVVPSALAVRAAESLAVAREASSRLILSIGARATTVLQIDGTKFAVRSLAMGGNALVAVPGETGDTTPPLPERPESRAGGGAGTYSSASVTGNSASWRAL